MLGHAHSREPLIREYVCALGHVWWAYPGGKGCTYVDGRGAACPAPKRWTGRERGSVLDDAGALEAFIQHVVGAELPDHWMWCGSTSYGRPSFAPWRGCRVEVRRLAYEKWRGKVPGGKRVRPKCGEELCVNPWHLKIGPWFEARPNWKPTAAARREAR